MSTYEGEMDTNEIDDAESKYFQEVSLYEDTADQSSGSFQGSLAVPTFSMDSSNSGRTEGCQVVGQSRGRVELSTLALQGSQGFQTLDQSAMGVQWQTMGSDSEQVSHRISGDQTVAVDMFRTGASNIQQNTTLAGIDLLEVKDTDNFLLMNAIPSDFLTKGPYTVMTSEANRMDISNTSFADSTMCNVNEPVYVQMVSAASAMESSSQETTCRSPKRRQRKSRSSSHQGSELQSQKSDSGRPSVSPNRGEHSSADGQGGSELSFKPSLLEEILTEKKLALMRSPEVMQFLQSQQEQRTCTRQENIGHGQQTQTS